MKEKLLESIEHYTESRHFSVHHTVVGEDMKNALYVHCHPETEIFYVRKGRLQFYVEGKEYTLCSGDGIFIPASLVHNAQKREGESCEYTATVFSESWLLGYTEAGSNRYTKALKTNRGECTYVISGKEPENEELLRIISGFDRYMKLPVEQYELRFIGELFICFQELYQRHFSKIGIQDETAESRLGIQQSLDYIQEHYAKNLTLEELAEKSGYSISHFGHRFKEFTGEAPFEYVNRIRVIKASEALLFSSRHITQIAGECGFNNISYFNRVFKKIIGFSPREYRKKLFEKNFEKFSNR